jgi:hypothetical protein
MNNGKTKKNRVQQPNNFLILEVKNYFYCLEFYEKSKQPLINNFKFC